MLPLALAYWIWVLRWATNWYSHWAWDCSFSGLTCQYEQNASSSSVVAALTGTLFLKQMALKVFGSGAQPSSGIEK